MANSSRISDEVIQHGINLSKRMDASLEILHLLKEGVNRSVTNFKERIETLDPGEPVAYIPLSNDRGLTTETVEYAQNRRNILCVVLSLRGEGAPRKKGVREEKFNEVTKLLNCPVVLHTESATK